MRHGFLLIDKPIGPTSHDCVAMVRKALHERSVGHIGTLDPGASGLMVLAVGAKALKVIEFFQGLPKEYIADITFGKVSSSYDGDGVIETYAIKPGVPEPDEGHVRRMIADRFIGKIQQVPPAHSAVHIDGERAYALARRGEEVKLKPREVTITKCDVLSYNYPRLQLRIACGSGTYIRSLAHDLGESLRVGAYLSGLRRSAVGDWQVDDAVSLKDVTWGDVKPLKDMLTSLPAMELTDDDVKEIGFGRTVPHTIEEETIGWHNGLPVAVMIPSPKDPSVSRPRKVL